MAPISAVIRHPACAAKPTAAMSGASSLGFASADMAPANGPIPSMSRAVKPTMPIIAPATAPMMTSTGTTPPPTMTDRPPPQARSVKTATTCLR